MADREFETWRAWLVLSAIGAVVSGLALLIISAAFDGFWAVSWATEWRTFWAQLMVSIGAALVSIGIALLITDVLLKPTFVREIFKIANLRQRVNEIGLLELGPTARVDWPELFQRSRSIHVIVTHPDVWMANHLMQVAECARRPSQVHLYLADPSGASIEQVANGYGLDAGVYRAQLEAFVERVSAEWRGTTPRHRASQLELHYLDDAPTVAISRFDAEIIVAIPAEVADSSATWLYLELREGFSDVQRWAESRWAAAVRSLNSTPAWSSAITPPTEATVRERLETRLHAKGSEK